MSARANALTAAVLLAAIAFSAAYNSSPKTATSTPTQRQTFTPAPIINEPELLKAADDATGAYWPDFYVMLEHPQERIALTYSITDMGSIRQWQLFRCRPGQPWQKLGETDTGGEEYPWPHEPEELKSLGIVKLRPGQWEALCKGEHRRFRGDD